jgi:hypothetical protein
MAGAALADEGDRFVNDVAEASGHAIGMGLIPAACAKLDETPMMTMSRMLLARKQSLGSHVMDKTVPSVGWRRLITRLLAARQDEQTQRGHNMRFGVINIPLQATEPCSHARPAVTGSGCDFSADEAARFCSGDTDMRRLTQKITTTRAIRAADFIYAGGRRRQRRDCARVCAGARWGAL